MCPVSSQVRSGDLCTTRRRDSHDALDFQALSIASQDQAHSSSRSATASKIFLQLTSLVASVALAGAGWSTSAQRLTNPAISTRGAKDEGKATGGLRVASMVRTL
jgi:hypothetical protein